MLLAVSNIPYEDCLRTLSEYSDLREREILPYGQLPILTAGSGKDQMVFGQSCAIARYVAKLGGLYPDPNPIQAIYTDDIVDSWCDMLDRFYGTIFVVS